MTTNETVSGESPIAGIPQTEDDSSPPARRPATRGSEVTRTGEVAQPHILVITGDPTQPSRKWDYAIECPGVTDECRVYNECIGCRQNREPAGKQIGGRREIHGVEHTWTTFGWATPSDDCLGTLEDMPWEVGTDLVSNECLPHPGRYAARWTQAGGSAVGDLELVGEAVTR